MPDLFGHLDKLAARDCRSGPAMTLTVMPDLIGHLDKSGAHEIAGRGRQ